MSGSGDCDEPLFPALALHEVFDGLDVRIYVRRDHPPEAWADYRRLNTPLYNNRPSSFGPGRTRMNLRLVDRWYDAGGLADLIYATNLERSQSRRS